MLFDPKNLFYRCNIFQNTLFVRCRVSHFFADYHYIFRSVFQRDKFKYIGFIAVCFQNHGTYGVSDNLGLSLFENTKFGDIAQFVRHVECFSDLLMAAWSTNNQFSIRLYSSKNGIVGSGVAGMQCNQYVYFF